MNRSEVNNFQALKLNKWLGDQCKKLGITKPTPIQEKCIPEILAGKDCIGCAKTGSGKTLAFVLPILQKLYEDPYGIFALVLTPTRELAFQIADQFAVIGKPVNLRTCVVVGRMDMVVQGLELSKRPHIVVATPGRLADHLEGCDTFSLQKIKFIVLDEADRLLSGMFNEQLLTIFNALPKNRQNLLFSATMTDSLGKVKQIITNEVFTFEAVDDGIATVKQLQQHYVLCPINVRDAYLVQVIRTFRETNKNGSIMIFAETCINCHLLSTTLNEIGFVNVALHGMMKQKERLDVLHKFKAHQVKILIATDVAARGLDIPLVELVLNHTIPNVPKEYVHRVGRTARAGRDGMAISLISPHDLKLLQAIEETIGIKLTEYKIDDKEVAVIFTQVSVTKREAEMAVDEAEFYEKKLIYKKKKLIMAGMDPEEADEFLQNKFKHKKHKKRKVRADNQNDMNLEKVEKGFEIPKEKPNINNTDESEKEWIQDQMKENMVSEDSRVKNKEKLLELTSEVSNELTKKKEFRDKSFTREVKKKNKKKIGNEFVPSKKASIRKAKDRKNSKSNLIKKRKKLVVD